MKTQTTQTIIRTNSQLPFAWLVLADQPPYPYRETIGDPEEELAQAANPAFVSAFVAPEIEPDEFEAAYLWFLS